MKQDYYGMSAVQTADMKKVYKVYWRAEGSTTPHTFGTAEQKAPGSKEFKVWFGKFGHKTTLLGTYAEKDIIGAIDKAHNEWRQRMSKALRARRRADILKVSA